MSWRTDNLSERCCRTAADGALQQDWGVAAALLAAGRLRLSGTARRGRRVLTLRRHAVIIHTPTGVPAGYPTWFDFAVANMELPASCAGARTDEDLAAQRLAIRDAARTELNILRRQ